MMVTVIQLHGPDQAIAACDRIERRLHDAAGRAQRACQEAAQELKHMLNLINADRAARGGLPLDAEISVPGKGIYDLYRHQAAKAEALAVPLGAGRGADCCVTRHGDRDRHRSVHHRRR
jgi:hypothetical protein